MLRLASVTCFFLGTVGCFATAPTQTRQCTSTDQCAAGALCNKNTGQCQAICRSHSDCADNHVCDGVCVPFASDCSTHDDCRNGAYCADRRCAKQGGLGAPCVTSSACTTGACVAGLCCSSSCEGSCWACARTLTGAADGLCAPVSAGQDPNNACPGVLACNGTGSCFVGDDGEACEVDAACQSGVCSGGTCARCGDGRLTPNEDCDDGDTVDTHNGCDSACTKNAECGNGEVEDLFEECDDQNDVGGDGCGNCRVEPFFACEGQPSVCRAVIYVDARASGANNGANWTNAFTSLQDALSTAQQIATPVEVWVAAGRYVPGETPAASFVVGPKVTLYGGFRGGEQFLSERDPDHALTILSGDIADNDTTFGAADNSTCVVTNHGVLDGVVVERGYAPNYRGAGVAGGVVRNAIIRDNVAESCAGLSEVTLVSSRVLRNAALGLGGGGCNVTATDSDFYENQARTGGALAQSTINGGAFFNNHADSGGALAYSRAERVHLYGNTATRGGGASDVLIYNSVISDNRAQDGGGIYWAEWTRRPNYDGIIRDLVIKDNVASRYGGGLAISQTADVRDDYSSYAQGERLLIEGNVAQYGGGVYVDVRFALTNSTVRRNRATQDGGGFFITAIYGLGRQWQHLRRLTVEDNVAQRHGGGIATSERTEISQSVFFHNHAGQRGGGIASLTGILYGLDYPADQVINGATLVLNTAGTSGPALYVTTNNVDATWLLLHHNSLTPSGSSAQAHVASGTLSITKSSVAGGYTGASNTTAVPVFTAMNAGDLHVSAVLSPWLDGERENGNDFDRDGNPRYCHVSGTTYRRYMGAYQPPCN